MIVFRLLGFGLALGAFGFLGLWVLDFACAVGLWALSLCFKLMVLSVWICKTKLSEHIRM